METDNRHSNNNIIEAELKTVTEVGCDVMTHTYNASDLGG